MKHRSELASVAFLLAIGIATALALGVRASAAGAVRCCAPAGAQGAASLSGRVRTAEGQPLGAVWVRAQTTANLTFSAADGSFTLGGLTAGQPVTITAWHAGYKIGWLFVTPPASDLILTLRKYDTRDNPDYTWNTSYADPANPTMGCGHCMAPSFDEWGRSAHAGAATNPRFFSLYNGANLGGQPVAPGYKLDFPGTAGNCATCHAPGAAANAPLTTDMNLVAGVAREGVFCEFCHKVGEVILDPATQRPPEDAPGVLSLRLHRSYPGDQIFFGTLDDVTRRVSYLPLEQQSRFCAPCHQASFDGTPIYQSYREWQESPYPAAGIECQTCHMPPGTSPTFVLPAKGGLVRDPARLASHQDLGLKDAAFMRSAVAMTVTARQTAAAVHVEVTLQNIGAGHHVPTDSPLRNMLLVIAATDGTWQSLAQQSGPVVPPWGGDLAGQPGQGYAKILQDVATGEAPVASYWKPTRILSDNRLPARGFDTTRYTFALPAAGAPAQITATLTFRRAFRALEQAKGWPASDLLMAQVVTQAVTAPTVFLPLVLRAQPPPQTLRELNSSTTIWQRRLR
jgi:hypothetical protein